MCVTSGGEVQGLAKLMLDELARHLHFTYHLQEEPPDGYWGELINDTWMGMAGQLVRGEKDLIIDGFAILLNRYHALDLSLPYFTDSYSAALKVLYCLLLSLPSPVGAHMLNKIVSC